MADLKLAAALFVPLFVGLVAHGIVIKLNWLRPLCRPIDGGARCRGRALFGENKTYRGMVVVALGSGAGYALAGSLPVLSAEPLRALSLPALAGFGIAVGLAAMLSELPNSFLKRQLDVAPGRPAHGALGALFYALDQVDFLLGAWLVMLLIVEPTWSLAAWSLLLVFVLHQVISLAGYALGMRKSAR